MHKKICFLLFIIVLLLTLPGTAHAHIAGQPPFFLINNKYADFYPIYSTSLKSFELPQDIAVENYIVNKPILFEIETQMLPFPEVVTNQIKFTWDFGDNSSGTGTRNQHAYSKIGTYLVKIHADYGEYKDDNTKPIIQAVILHVLPNKNYVLPKPYIVVNEQVIKDPLIDTVSVKSGDKVNFKVDLEKSSSKIKSYMWDKGNSETTNSRSFSIKYNSNLPAYVFPFVRVTDENGFYVDNYAQIENTVDENGTASNLSFIQQYGLYILIIFNLVIVTAVIVIYKLIKKRR